MHNIIKLVKLSNEFVFRYSDDGKFIQSNCGAYELLFSDANTGQQITKLDSMNGALLFSINTIAPNLSLSFFLSFNVVGVSWSTWTCTLGWPVLGTWEKGWDGTDINAVSRSPSGNLLASADDFGKLRVFSYPCTLEGAPCSSYSGHSSFVQNVTWLHGANKSSDEYVITVGGNDKCVFQWRNDLAGAAEKRPSAAVAGTPSPKEVEAEGHDGAGEEDGALPTGGDEFMAVKPYLGAIVAPTAYAGPTADPEKAAKFFTALEAFGAKHSALPAGGNYTEVT